MAVSRCVPPPRLAWVKAGMVTENRRRQRGARILNEIHL
jgi:hypothetical protein